MPTSDDLKERIMEKAYKSNFTIHPGKTKMYQKLTEIFWWPGMKKDIMEVVGE